MLRYQADIRSLCFVALTLALLAVAIRVNVGYVSLVIVPSGTFLAFVCCIITHNHAHCPIFKSKLANRLFDLFLALAKGHSVQTVVIPHNQNHHVFHGRSGDWIAVEHAGTLSGVPRIIRFVARSVLTMARQRRLTSAPQPTATMLRSMNEQRALIYGFALIFLMVNPASFVLHALTPWILAMLILVSVNLFQHDGCDLDSDVNRARNFTSSIGNWLLFNNGYHMIHHRYPRLHWSLLKKRHELEVLPYADPSLQEESLILFLYSKYLQNQVASPGQTEARANK